MLPLYRVSVSVHDLFSWLMRRDLFIALVALGVGVGAAMLVLGSDREPSPASAATWGSMWAVSVRDC